MAKQLKERMKLQKQLEFQTKIAAFDSNHITSRIYPEKKSCYKPRNKLKHGSIVKKALDPVPNNDFFIHLENKKKKEREEKKGALAKIIAPSMPLLK